MVPHPSCSQLNAIVAVTAGRRDRSCDGVRSASLRLVFDSTWFLGGPIDGIDAPATLAAIPHVPKRPIYEGHSQRQRGLHDVEVDDISHNERFVIVLGRQLKALTAERVLEASKNIDGSADFREDLIAWKPVVFVVLLRLLVLRALQVVELPLGLAKTHGLCPSQHQRALRCDVLFVVGHDASQGLGQKRKQLHDNARTGQTLHGLERVEPGVQVSVLCQGACDGTAVVRVHVADEFLECTIGIIDPVLDGCDDSSAEAQHDAEELGYKADLLQHKAELLLCLLEVVGHHASKSRLSRAPNILHALFCSAGGRGRSLVRELGEFVGYFGHVLDHAVLLVPSQRGGQLAIDGAANALQVGEAVRETSRAVADCSIVAALRGPFGWNVQCLAILQHDSIACEVEGRGVRPPQCLHRVRAQWKEVCRVLKLNRVERDNDWCCCMDWCGRRSLR